MRRRPLLGLIMSLFIMLIGLGGVTLFYLSKSTVCTPEDGSSLYGKAKMQILPFAYTCDWSTVDQKLVASEPENFKTNKHYITSPYVAYLGFSGVYYFGITLIRRRKQKKFDALRVEEKIE